MKRIMTLMLIVMLMVTGCQSKTGTELKSGDITKDNIDAVVKLLTEAKLNHVDAFKQAVINYYDQDDSGDAQSGFQDANCRLTVLMLAGDSISYDHIDDQYKGDYLMFDVDAIEHMDDYPFLQNQKSLLTTMFGEMPMTNNAFDQALPDNWSNHNFKFNNDYCSIISIVFKAYEEDLAFVGHTGILINKGNQSYFVEKIAFSEPYRLTVVKDDNELIDVLSKRDEFTTEADEPTPLVYKNNQFIGALKQ